MGLTLPRLLADPDYQRIYTRNNLIPGFIPHAEYVTFLNEFGGQTEAYLKETGVIR